MKIQHHLNGMLDNGRLFVFHALLAISIFTNAQIPNNSWRDHFPYNHAKMIAITPQKVFCSMSTGGMLAYTKNSGEIEKLSKVTGLSDVNITAIAYSDLTNILLIGYKNGNIDLITSNGLINMPAIKNKQISGLKIINSISVDGNRAFLACNFGIVEIDLNKIEVRDSYFFGPSGTSLKVNDVAIFDTKLYAATEFGIYKVDLNSPNLVDYSYWQNINTLPQNNNEYKLIESVNNEIFAVFNNESSGIDEIVRLNSDDTWSYWKPISEELIYQLTFYNNELSVVTNYTCYFFSSELQPLNSLTVDNGRYAAVDTDGTSYAASYANGLMVLKNGADQANYPTFTAPRFNATGYIDTQGDQVWVGSGGPFNPYYLAGAYNFTNDKWVSLNNGYAEGIDNIGNFFRFAYHPSIDNYVYASSYLYALFEIKDYKVIAKHDLNSVPLFQQALRPEVGVRIMGLDFDNKGTLWTIMDATIQPVFVLRGGTEWEQLVLNSSIFKSSGQWRDLIVTKTNQVWILNANNGVVVLQEQSDGSILEKYFKLINSDGELLTKAYCLAEDKDGDVWIGTNKGPIVYSSSNQLFENDEVIGNQIKIPRNDGTNMADYLLDYEIINEIAVDGGNRKWLATETSGLFLVSADGLETIHQFNAANSPMISNNVISVGVQEKTGEVFISTNEGLISFMGRATEGNEDFTDVYVYPNPVRPEYDGDITIRGLIEDASVKITDISGNLVYETTSLGGQAVWDGKNFDGNRVHTGVYIVFLTNDDGSKTHITKLVFIH
jgi:hypothetical protein